MTLHYAPLFKILATIFYIHAYIIAIYIYMCMYINKKEQNYITICNNTFTFLY